MATSDLTGFGRAPKVRRVSAAAARPLLGLIETARGVRDVDALCDSRLIDRVAFGSVDFAVELGLDPVTRSATLTYARSILVVASAAAGLPLPLDGVTTAVDDPSRLGADVAEAVAMGFGGKLAVHPRQVAAINHAWTPAPALVSWAERVVAATSPGAADIHGQSGECAVGVTIVDGQMVDLPVITRAKHILARATRDMRPATEKPTTANGMT